MSCKVISGLTEQTPQKLLLDAGAFFKDFNVVEVGDTPADTFESAVAAGKLLGATKGGGSFSSVPTFREIEIDGARGRVKELKQIESIETKISANIIEVSVESLRAALAASVIDDTDTKYTKISGKFCISPDDYIGNITWVGTLSGNQEPVIIQVFNALSESGLELSFEDKGEAVVALELFAHQSLANLDETPWTIWYPKVSG